MLGDKHGLVHWRLVHEGPRTVESDRRSSRMKFLSWLISESTHVHFDTPWAPFGSETMTRPYKTHASSAGMQVRQAKPRTVTG